MSHADTTGEPVTLLLCWQQNNTFGAEVNSLLNVMLNDFALDEAVTLTAPLCILMFDPEGTDNFPLLSTVIVLPSTITPPRTLVVALGNVYTVSVNTALLGTDFLRV